MYKAYWLCANVTLKQKRKKSNMFKEFPSVPFKY